MTDVETLIERLVAAGLLSEQMAEAYVYRYHSDINREQAAEKIGITTSAFDDRRGNADEKIEEAKKTLRILDDARTKELDGTVSIDGAEDLLDDVDGDPAEKPRMQRFDDDVQGAGADADRGGSDRIMATIMDAEPVDPADDDPAEQKASSDERVHEFLDERQDVAESVADLDLPGDGSALDDRRAAVAACIEYLNAEGEAKKSDFQRDVMPGRMAGFGSAGGWWNGIGKVGLSAAAEEIEEMEPPGGEGAHMWRWGVESE